MPIVDADLWYFKSSRANCDGGTITPTMLVNGTLNNLFRDVTPTQASTGITTYRKIFIKNYTGADTVIGVKCWKLQSTVALGDEIYLGVGNDTDEDGSAVTYYDALSRETGLDLGNIAPGQAKAIWLKRVVTPGGAYKPLNSCIIKCQGEDY